MSIEWLVIRGSGVAAFAMLGLAVVWGLMMSTGLLGRAASTKAMTWFHESLALGSLVATGVHMVALASHDYVDFTWTEILVPGASRWRPLAVSFGVVGFYVLALVTVSFYFKKVIGHNTWRAIHGLSFGLFLVTLVHGISAGTDNGHPAVAALYAGFAAATAFLIVVRVVMGLRARVGPSDTARAR